ncbi:hypothetical protein KRX57_06850 [Weeksellaceae bacterium TAE3-ERU29]|nr:hypothetical protein [Weeksellaceae bacterium TAE3-ERU29]
MKKTLKIFGILSLILVAFAFTSCSSDDDPADNDLFIGKYKGKVTYTNGDENKSNDDGSVTVTKVGNTYSFTFSDGIPAITGVEMDKNQHIAISLGDENSYIRINEDVLKLLYNKDGATWTADVKR